jgi:hypothetical protein
MVMSGSDSLGRELYAADPKIMIKMERTTTLILLRTAVAVMIMSR